MGQLQNQFQQMIGRSPYSGGGGQQQPRISPVSSMGFQQGMGPGYAGGQQRGNFGTPGYQQPQTRGSGGYSGQQQTLPAPWPAAGAGPNTYGQPGRGGPPMVPPTKQPPTTVPPGTGGIKPQREPVGPPVPSTTPQNPAQQRIDPSRVQASAAGQMQAGSVSQPVGQMQPTPYQGPFQGYREMPGGRNPYRGHGGGPRRDGGPGSMG